MSGWNSKETVLQFIEIYRTLPALWKVKSKEYSNKLTKELAYSTLIEFCRKFEQSADKQFVVNKINNLRSAFRKELKKVDKSKLSGAGRNDIYCPSLWYFPYLMFIQDQEVPRTGISNLDIDNVRPPSMESESPSASSFAVDAHDNYRNDDFTQFETLSQSSTFSDVSSQSTSYFQVSPLVRTPLPSQGPSPGPSHSQGPSPGPLQSQVPSPGPSQPQVPSPGPSRFQGPSTGPSHSQSPSPDLSQSQGPSPGPSHSQDQFPLDSSPCSTPRGFSARPAPKTPAGKRPNKRKCEDEELLIAARARLLNPTPPPPLDENDSFGKTIGLLLKNASKEQRIYARKLMLEVMAEAELGNLSQASHLVVSSDFRGARRVENVQNYMTYYQKE